MNIRTCARVFACTLFALGLAGAAAAQPYPNRPVTMIVPFPPGGITDTLARALAQKLQADLGQTVIVDNKPGAGGQIGAAALKNAPADGHTLFVGATEMFAINQYLYRQFSYDPLKDMQAVAPLAYSPLVLVVPQESPADSVEELVALSRRKGLNFASQGMGSIGHLLGELFRGKTGADILHVAYRGSAPALKDLVGNQVDMMFDPVLTAGPLIAANRLKPLAIAAPRSAAVLPEVKPLASLGVKDVDASVWFGVTVRAGTPAAVVERLNAAIGQAMNAQDLVERYTPQGLEMMRMTPREFAAFMQDEVKRWGPLVKASGAAVD